MSRSSRCCSSRSAIFPENVKDVVADGYVEASAICTNAKLKAACEENGVG